MLPELASPPDDPMELFRSWLDAAREADAKYVDAVSLATVDPAGMPDVRIVLLRRIKPEGFLFFTNYESTKSKQLLTSEKAALCLYWKPLDRQVRVRGTVAKASPADSDEYFSTRPRQSQIGAWASRQSLAIASRAVLEQRYREMEARFDGAPVPRPPHWGGFLLQPSSIEFWAEGEWRLHDRLLYTRTPDGAGWKKSVLSP